MIQVIWSWRAGVIKLSLPLEGVYAASNLDDVVVNVIPQDIYISFLLFYGHDVYPGLRLHPFCYCVDQPASMT